MPLIRPLPGLLVAVLTLTAGLGVTARAADPVVVSTRATAAISADGTLLEWTALQLVAQGLQVAAANDDVSVYLAVLASTPQMRVSLSDGVVLWLDASGGRKETFGLQLPGPSRLDAASVSATGGIRLTPTVSDHVDVLGPGKFSRRLVPLDPSSGVAVGIGGEDGGMAFEVRVPLATSALSPIALGTSAGRTFTLGIATPVRRKGPREPMEPIVLFDPYRDLRYPGRIPLPPTAPLTNAADRPEKEIKPKTVNVWVSVRLASAK